MQYPLFHNTTCRPDHTRDWIKEKGLDRPPVESPISKSVDLYELFNKTISPLSEPAFDPFPLNIEDDRMAFRMKDILGIPQDKGTPYLAQNKSVLAWLNEFEGRIGKDHIEGMYIVGSATAFIAGQPLLREALDLFSRRIPENQPDKYSLIAKMYGKISQKTYSFADVDLRIKVKKNFPLYELQNEYKEFRSDLFNGRSLIVHIGEEEKNTIDLCIYWELDTDSASNLDDFKIDIKKSELEKNRIVFESTHPWKWWEGQIFGVLEDYTSDKYRSFLRLLWQESKGKISKFKTASGSFPIWFEKMSLLLKAKELDAETQPADINKNVLENQFYKQESQHDKNVPLAGLLQRLRAQQIIRNHSESTEKECPEKKNTLIFCPANYSRLLRETAKTKVSESTPPFIKAIYHVMQDKGSDILAVHSMIECIANLAIYEAWKKPFEVKYVFHEGVWMLRIRFRGTFGKRDLLVRFDLQASQTFIKKATLAQWEKMRIIFHSLCFDDFSQREMGKEYRSKFLKDFNPIDIKRRFLSLTGPFKKEIPFVQYQPLALMEISSSDEPKILLAIGKLVFNHYHYQNNLRIQLCWRVVNKCIDARGFSEAAELVGMLREKHLDPEEGYPSLFARVVLKEGDCSSLYEVCSPFPAITEEKWLALARSKAKAKFVVALMNGLDISAEFFLEMTHLLKIKNPEVGESMLQKIVLSDSKRGCQWIESHDKLDFASEEYNHLVRQHIIERKSSFTHSWLRKYLLSKRFQGSKTELLALCQYLFSKPLTTQEKTQLLQELEIKEEALWQVVANEYIGQRKSWPDSFNEHANIKSETLVLWIDIIEHADNGPFIEDCLKKIKAIDPNTHVTIRQFIFVTLLKNWSRKKVDIPFLMKLALSKNIIPWKEIVQKANSGEDILKELYKKSLTVTDEEALKTFLHFYSSLFRELRPEGEYYATCWVKMVQNAFPEPHNAEQESTKEKNLGLLAILDRPLMTECFQRFPKASLPLLKRLIKYEEGIRFALEVVTEPDSEMMDTLFNACILFDDHGASAGRVFSKFYDSKKHKNNKFSNELALFAKQIISHPKGDIEVAGSMWKVVKKLAIPENIPSTGHLIKLIQKGYSEWVISILNNAKPEELDNIDPEVYCRLIRSVNDLDTRCVILTGCRVISASTQKIWETTAQSDGIDHFSAAKLLSAGATLRVADAQVQKFALAHLSPSITLDEAVKKHLIGMTSRLDSSKAFTLWEALCKAKQGERMELWSAGVQIISKSPHIPHYNILSWLIRYCPSHLSAQLLDLLAKVTEHSVDEGIGSLILPFVKREILKNSENAKAIYWKLDCDENISLDDLSALKPNKEECLKVLNRLMKKQKGKTLTHQVFSSIIYIWVTYRVCTKNEGNNIDLNASIYKLMTSYIPSLKDEEKIKWILKTVAPALLDMPEMKGNIEFQETCKLILEYGEEIPIDEKYHLLACLTSHKFLLDHAWKLIVSLGSSNQEVYFGCAVNALMQLENVDRCPARLVFQCHYFPAYTTKFDLILRKIKDKPRAAYLVGILLSSIIIKNPSKSTVLLYVEYLIFTLNYLESHRKAELGCWLDENLKLVKKYDFDLNNAYKNYTDFDPELFKTHESQIKDRIPTISELFSQYIGISLMNSDLNIFYDVEVMKIFLEKVNHFAKDLVLRFCILLIITPLSLKNGNKETASLIASSIFKSHSSKEMNELMQENNILMIQNILLCMTARLLVKFSIHDLQNTCCEILLQYNNFTSNKNRTMLVRACGAHMALKGDIHSFTNCTPDETSMAIRDAIKLLCKYPNHANLNMAQQLLLEGTPEVLFLFPHHLRDANKYLVDASIKKVSPTSLPILIPQLFLHLSHPQAKVDCFDMTREQIKGHLRYILSKCGAEIYLLHLDDANFENIRTSRLDLVLYNVNAIATFFPNYMHCFIGILNASIFTLLRNQFIKYPEKLEKLMLEIKSGSKIRNQEAPQRDLKCANAIGVLFCSHPYIPFDGWAPYFAEAQLDFLFQDIQLARTYFSALEKCGRSKGALLELSPQRGLYEAELSMNPDTFDKEIAMRYQWLHGTCSIFKDAPLDEDTLTWMNIIQDEFIQCLKISQRTTSLEALTVNILFILQQVIEFNGKIAKRDPIFANSWHQSLIQKLEDNFKSESCKWFLGLIEDKLQMFITPELLPSLPSIERFSCSLSLGHKKRNCVDALYQLLSFGCTDDSVIDKAIKNLNYISDKARISSANTPLPDGTTNFQWVPDTDFERKLEYIYATGLRRMFAKFRDHKSHERLLSDLMEFRNHTDNALHQLKNVIIFLNNIFPVIHNNLDCLTDQKVCTEIIELLSFISILQEARTDLTLNQFSTAKNSSLMLMLFLGPENEESATNDYLTTYAMEFYQTHEEHEMRELVHKELLSVFIKCTSALKMLIPNREFHKIFQGRAIADSNFKTLYLDSLNEVIQDMIKFAELRPQKKSWYYLIRRIVEDDINYVFRKIEEEKLLPKKEITI